MGQLSQNLLKGGNFCKTCSPPLGGRKKRGGGRGWGGAILSDLESLRSSEELWRALGSSRELWGALKSEILGILRV